MPIDPQFRAWVERERAWGARAVAAIDRGARESSDATGLERFATRMAIVELTGSVARWANGVNAGLCRAGCAEAAAAFARTPPVAGAPPTPDDYHRLDEYVQARLKVLVELLATNADP
jgi:hypothetical protein